MSITIDPFNWNSFATDPPKNLKVVRANDHCLVLERNRDGYKERFVVGKTGDQFSIFRVNVSMGEPDIAIDEKTRIATGELSKVLGLLGYKTSYLTLKRKSSSLSM